MTETMTASTAQDPGTDGVSATDEPAMLGTAEPLAADELVMFGTDEPVAGVPLERLEEEMRSLAGHLAAATCSFLVMVGEYDARKGWESWEAHSCAHWLNWRCGTGMSAAREQVRVARKLRDYPAIRARFAAGAITYSKVRAITRVVHPAIEERLLDLARDATGAQLERACSALRHAQDQNRADVDLANAEDTAQASRSLRWRTDPDTGDLLVQLRIPAGPDSDTFRTQIGGATLTEAAPGDDLDDLECRRLDALLDLTTAGTTVDTSTAEQPEVIIHLTPPTTTTGSTRPDTAQPDSTGDHPASDTAPRSTPSSSAEEPVRRTASSAHDPLGLLEPWPIRTATGTQLSTAYLSQLSCDAGFRTVVDHTLPNHDNSYNESGTPTGDTGPATPWNPFDPPEMISLDLGRHQRFPNRPLRRSVLRRDGGSCRFPGCTTRHRLHLHHIIYWEHGGRTDRANLLTLCTTHHRAVHRRHWAITGTATAPTFTRPDGRTSHRNAPTTTGTLAQLVAANQRHGRDIATDGAASNWLGDHIDWDCFFAAFNNGPQTIPPEHY